jgi:hypothetical protein
VEKWDDNIGWKTGIIIRMDNWGEKWDDNTDG